MSYYTSVIIITLLALGVLSILIYENNRISPDKKRTFLFANLLIGLAALAECAGVHISGNPAVPKDYLTVAKALDYTLTPMSGGALIGLMQRPKAKNRLLWGVLLGNAIIQTVAATQGWMVVIDDQNHYIHGPLYPAYMVLYCLVIVILTVQMLSYGKSFRKQNRKSLYAIIALAFIGIGIQELAGNGCRVSYLALTFGVTFLFIHYSEFAQLQMDEKLSEQRLKIANDPLTGALSRFAYMEAMASYAGGVPEDLAVFLVDINGLKRVNDSLGHEAGDELICGAAACVEDTVGCGGKTFRIGGDEFVAFAAMTREQAAAALAALAERTGSWSGEKVQSLSVSAGCALARDFAGYSVEELIKEADRKMYAQKMAYYQTTGSAYRDSRRCGT